jgi:Fe-S-cluster containining protein
MLADMKLSAGDTELVQIMDAALADAASRAGPWLVCRLGCTQCCFGVFSINQLDALRLRAGMDALRSSDPTLPGDAQTGMLGESESDIERFEAFANEAACPALDPETGRCDVYAWRPMTCRVFGPPVRMSEGHELGHCELCFGGASEEEVRACEMEIPHELETKLVGELGAGGETVVAFALLR